MPFKVEWEVHGVLATFSGKPDFSELRRCDHIVNGDERFQNSRYFLYDLLAADLSDFELPDANEMARFDLDIADLNENLKLALITVNRKGLELCSQYISYCRLMKMPWKIEIFSSLREAREWVAE